MINFISHWYVFIGHLVQIVIEFSILSVGQNIALILCFNPLYHTTIKYSVNYMFIFLYVT